MLSIILPNHREPTLSIFLAEIRRTFPEAQVIVSDDDESRGKGWAVRQGVTRATGDLIAFLDGDGEIPIRMLSRMIPFMEDFSVVVGSKRITRAPMRRKVMTRLTRVWFKLLFGLKVDTQTGIKLFRRQAIDSINRSWEANGFIFDVEILAALRKNGYDMVEVPIECEIRRQLAFKTIFRIFGESVWLKWRMLWSR